MQLSMSPFVSVQLREVSEVKKRLDFFSLIADFPFEEMLEKTYDKGLTTWFVRYEEAGVVKDRYISLDGHLYNAWIRHYLENVPENDQLLIEVITLGLLGQAGVTSVQLYEYVADGAEGPVFESRIFYHRAFTEEAADMFPVAVFIFDEDDPYEYYLQDLVRFELSDVLGVIRDPMGSGGVEGYVYVKDVKKLLEILAPDEARIEDSTVYYLLARRVASVWGEEVAEEASYTILSADDMVQSFLAPTSSP